MVVLGQVQSGSIIIEGQTKLPEGARVRIEVLGAADSQREPEQPEPTLFDKLRGVAGIAKGLPSDLASQHDHYIHGQSKQCE